MSKTDNIEIFNDIHSYEEYSTYSKDLNKLYGNKSFKNFFGNLKNRKPISLSNLEFTEIDNNERRYRKDELFDNKLFEKMLKSNSNAPIKPISQYTTAGSYRTLDNIKKKKRLRLFQLQNITSFGKYYPNYNAVNASKVPSVNFSKELPRPGFEDSQENVALENKASPKSKLDLKYHALPSIMKSTSQESIPPTLTTSLVTSERVRDILERKKNVNHALKFSQYTSRKDFAPLYHNNSCDKKDFLTPEKNIKGSVDFTKMLGNGHEMFSYRPLNGPTIGLYNPKYEAIQKKSPEVSFSRRSNKIKLNKKFLLKKLWSNYKVTHEYQLVNFKPRSNHHKSNDE